MQEWLSGHFKAFFLKQLSTQRHAFWSEWQEEARPEQLLNSRMKLFYSTEATKSPPPSTVAMYLLRGLALAVAGGQFFACKNGFRETPKGFLLSRQSWAP